MVDQNALVNGRIENNVNLLIVKVLLTFFFIYYFKSVKLHIQTTYPQCILDSNHLCFHWVGLRFPKWWIVGHSSTCPICGSLVIFCAGLVLLALDMASGSIMPLILRHSFVYVYIYCYIKIKCSRVRLFSMWRPSCAFPHVLRSPIW